MKLRTIAFLVCTLCLSSAIRAQNNFEIGQRSVTYVDESRNRPLVTELWYPTLDTFGSTTGVATQKVPFKGIATIPNATIVQTKFPLLLISHGTGGNRFSLTWFVEKMVKEGYIVVAVDHYGNTSFNKIPREFVKWWERAIDIKFILTKVLNDEYLGTHIDASKIGGVGFSLGGYTNIALAGGYVDRAANGNKGGLPPEFPESDEVIDFATDSRIVKSFKTYGKQVKDERINAFFVMAPAIGFGFHSNSQTTAITAPISIVAGKGDTNTPVKDNAQKYHTLISTSELYLFNEHVDHYAFLNEATEFGKQILPELTVDHPQVNRKEIHDRTLEIAIDFFKKNL